MQPLLVFLAGVGIGWLLFGLLKARQHERDRQLRKDHEDLLKAVGDLREEVTSLREARRPIMAGLAKLLAFPPGNSEDGQESQANQLDWLTKGDAPLPEPSGSVNDSISIRAETRHAINLALEAIGKLEEVGDELVRCFYIYQHGRRSYSGGRPLGGMISAVAQFIQQWSSVKRDLEEAISAFQGVNQAS